jgi:hypothetical protein
MPSSEWSGCRDLNSGPLVPQTSALTKLRHSPYFCVGRAYRAGAALASTIVDQNSQLIIWIMRNPR